MVKLATTTNIELVDIETTLLQASKVYKKQIRGDVYSIVDKLWVMIHRDCHIQVYPSRNYIPIVILSPNYTSSPFPQHVLCYSNHLSQWQMITQASKSQR